MSLFDRKAMLVAAAAAEVAGGCVDVGGDDQAELGAFGGVRDIPRALWNQQQWAGFATQPTTPAPGKPMLRLNLPLVYARDWTIQLAAPQVPAGAAIAVPSTNAATVTLRWGHHGSYDTVQFSWPDRGGAITVHGCFVELAVHDPTLAAAPTANYNAWLTEGAGARGGVSEFQPIHTVRVTASLAAAGGTALVVLSPRARAFYLTALPANFTAGQPIEMRLLDNLVARAVYEIDPGQGGAHSLLEFSREPFPVPPWINAVLFTNNGADVWDEVLIHQLLDLGG